MFFVVSDSLHKAVQASNGFKGCLLMSECFKVFSRFRLRFGKSFVARLQQKSIRSSKSSGKGIASASPGPRMASRGRGRGGGGMAGRPRMVKISPADEFDVF